MQGDIDSVPAAKRNAAQRKKKMGKKVTAGRLKVKATNISPSDLSEPAINI